MHVFIDSFPSPLGRIWMASDESGIIRILLPATSSKERLLSGLSARFARVRVTHGGEVPARLKEELDGYFKGRLTTFQTPITPHGTDFQKKVWRLLGRIPYGRTRTYGWLAHKLGIPGGARAVGQANRFNPLPLLIPCHRVTAGGGKLGGFACGIETKRWLLQWEEENRASLNS